MLDSTRAEGPSAVKHEVKPHIARGTLLILYAIIILIDDDTMLTREKSDDTATHSFKSIIYVHAFQLDTGHESRPNPIFRKVGITVYLYRDLFIDILIFLIR